MVRGLVKLLQFDLLSLTTEENRSPYQATVTIKNSEPTKEKTASVSKAGETGRTTETSIEGSLFKQQTMATVKCASSDESLSE